MKTKRAFTLDQVVHGKTYQLTVMDASGTERRGLVKADVTPQKIRVEPRMVVFATVDGDLSPGPIGEIISIVEP